MKRPFAVVGITYLIAQTVAVLCGFAVTTALFCVAMLCALVVLLIYKDRPVWLLPVLLSCAVCFAANAGHSLFREKPVRALEGQTVLLSGRICEAPYQSYGRNFYIIETDSVLLESMPQKVRFRLSSAKDLDAEYGDRIVTEVRFNYPDEKSSSARSLKADGIMLTGFLPFEETPEISEGSPSLYGWIIRLRQTFSSAASELMGEELGGLLTGMFTGDTSGIDSMTLVRFRDCGLSHLFSVSGLHLSVLTAALLLFLRRITPDYRITAFLCIPFVLFFMAFSGFSMSVRRAGIMTLLALIAAVVRREYDPLNSLGLAALVICILNPCAAGDAGMLMSFGSTAGIITLYVPVSRKLRSLLRFEPKSRFAFVLRPLIETIATSMIAQVFTAPIAVLCFGQMSLTAPVANVLCILPASGFMIIGAVATALYCVPVVGVALGFALMIPAWIAGRVCTVLTGLIALIPGSGLSVNYPFAGIFIAGSICMLIVWYMLFGKESSRTYSFGLCGAAILQVLMILVAVHNVTVLTSSGITVFGSDSGIMTALNSGGQCVIVGCGTDGFRGWLASEYLAEDNITDVLAVALPDNTMRYAEHASELIEMYQPDSVFLSDEGSAYELISQSARKTGSDMFLVNDAGYSAEGCRIRFRTYVDKEDNIWILAECGQLVMLVCPERGDCLLIPEEWRRPDVALMCAEGVANVTVIDPIAVMITAADSTEARRAAARMEYRGVKNVFAVPDDSRLNIAKSGQGIRVIEQ